MGILDILINRKPQRRLSRRAIPSDEASLRGWVTGQLAERALRGLGGADSERLGRRVLSQLIGVNNDPKTAIAEAALAEDPNFAQEAKQLFLEEWRSDIERKRGHRTGFGESGGEPDELDELGRQLLLERLQHENANNFSGVLTALAPAVTELFRLMAAQQRVVPDNNSINSLPAPPVQTQEASLMSEPSPLLFNIFDPDQVRDLLHKAETDPEAAGTEAAELIRQALESRSGVERAKTTVLVTGLLSLDTATLLTLLQEYQQHSDWASVISYAEQHQDVFGAFREALEDALRQEREPA